MFFCAPNLRECPEISADICKSTPLPTYWPSLVEIPWLVFHLCWRIKKSAVKYDGVAFVGHNRGRESPTRSHCSCWGQRQQHRQQRWDSTDNSDIRSGDNCTARRSSHASRMPRTLVISWHHVCDGFALVPCEHARFWESCTSGWLLKVVLARSAVRTLQWWWVYLCRHYCYRYCPMLNK